MTHRLTFSLLTAVGLLACPLAAQESATLRRAQVAYDGLEFERAIVLATQSLTGRLSLNDRVHAYELLGFAYGALDSARQAVEHFKNLIYLDPDREPDVTQVSPRITSFYASALGQVLVVRRLRVDSVTFVANEGGVPVQFQLSRPARAIVRVVGPNYDAVVDSQLVAGAGRFEWRAVTETGDPVPQGDYQIIVSAIEAGNEFSEPIDVRVFHAAVDTVAHLTDHPDYTPLPESERPPRNWRPLGVSVLYAGLTAGAVVALEHNDLGTTDRAVLGISAVAVLTGFVMSVRRPDPVPVPANIRYNTLIRDDLARRNATISGNNAQRRRQVLLTVTPYLETLAAGN